MVIDDRMLMKFGNEQERYNDGNAVVAAMIAARFCGSSIPSRFPVTVASTDSRLWIEYRTSTSPGQAMFAAKYEGTLHAPSTDSPVQLLTVNNVSSWFTAK